jgi:hypothetical protein
VIVTIIGLKSSDSYDNRVKVKCDRYDNRVKIKCDRYDNRVKVKS